MGLIYDEVSRGQAAFIDSFFAIIELELVAGGRVKLEVLVLLLHQHLLGVPMGLIEFSVVFDSLWNAIDHVSVELVILSAVGVCSYLLHQVGDVLLAKAGTG